MFFFIVLPVAFNGCLDQGESKWDKKAEDKPDVDHLDVRGGGQFLYLAHEYGRHHQHDGQVHGDYIAKEVFVKENGGEGDEEQEYGGEVGGQKLCGNLPLELQGHVNHVAYLLLGEGQVGHCEHGQVSVFK